MRSTASAFLFVLGLWLSPSIQAKEKVIAQVAPIHSGLVTYSLQQVNFLCENGEITVCGYHQIVEARESGQILWQTKIYKVVFNQKKSTRLQTIDPVSMKLEGLRIVVKDEKGLLYKLDTRTGRIINRKRAPLYYTK